MSQFAMLGMTERVWTPAELNRHVRQLLEGDYRLQDLWVAGEIANLSQPASGHLYFSLTDGQANLRCVMWRSEAAGLPRPLKHGEAVEVHGRLSVYEAGGQYQLYADLIRPTGEGLRYQEFLRLRDRLQAEGLFDPERKQALPRFPRRLGLVTSPTGAALQDVLNVLRRRYPLLQVILFPTVVQGEAAPEAIAQALAALDEHGSTDTILLVRGGGSLEDLWAFNTEPVVRAVAACRAPVVTGIGHETDVMLADFAADVHAPTPSAAAELATPDRQELRQEIDQAQAELRRAWSAQRRSLRAGLQQARTALLAQAPEARLANARQRLAELTARARLAARHRLSLQQAALAALSHTLQVVGPTQVLARGYAVVRLAADQALVRSVRQVSAGSGLRVQVSDGSFSAEATDAPAESSEA